MTDSNPGTAIIEPVITAARRPWGGFRQYVLNGSCTVSLMTVNPGERLSLQAHSRRGELWIVLDDGAIVQLEDRITEHRAGDEIWIPVNGKHRLSCAGTGPVRVLEVAFGNWEQTDITRYQDDYARPGRGE
jgi:mannose-1-phosphate guanylyltransferase/mannose-6-phosphate isomerase